MKRINLTEWALKHKALVYFFVGIVFLGGIYSYQNLGRMEDPDFTIREMIVTVNWPGATARQIEEQVTDKIEKKLQDTPGLDYLKSQSTPGQSKISVVLKDDAVSDSQIRPIWLEVRNMVNDIKDTLPNGVQGPYFNDRFDDVFGCIYALTGDGYSYEELRAHAEKIRRILLTVPNVKKVELTGVQAEKIYIEIETVKLAQLGIATTDITNAVQTQNSMADSGMLQTSTDNVHLRVTGAFENLENLKELPIRANGRTFRLGDIAKITRGYVDPADSKMFYNGQPAIGLSLSMEKGGNILKLGNNLEKTVAQIQKDLPAGLDLSSFSNQPKVVKESIDEFVKSLAEAIIIVLIVSFISLGVRSGVVVALCIPLIITGVFISMKIFGIDLHKISLGALIIALGLLVDDAIIAVEMMIVKLEQGCTRFEAACYAYTSTAFPMLTGTLITCAGFIPVGFSKGSASEFVGSIFSVITIALLISWLVSVLVTPLLGYKLIKVSPKAHEKDAYNTKFYLLFRKTLSWCLLHRKKVLTVTAACFVGSVLLLGLVRQEFFPASARPELIVEMRLPEGAAIQATEKEAARFANYFDEDPNVVNYAYYTGQGGPRFVLTFDPVLPDTNYAQFVFTSTDVKGREALARKAHELLAAEFPDVRGNIKILQSGPSAAYPVMLRVSGYDHNTVREIAEQVQSRMAASRNVTDVNLDWHEKSKVMHLHVDQDKARMLGVNSQTVAANLQALLSGATISEFREEDKTVGIVFRINPADRNDLSKIKDLAVPIGNGKFVPLDQIAKISFEAEEGLVWRRDLKPTITVQANTVEGVLGNDATQQAYEDLRDLRSALPPGYSIDIGGSTEMSVKAIGWLLGPVPVMLVIIVSLLMIQLQNISKMVLTLLTAPLGIIGVSLGLLVTGRPMGFVVQLGILALAGIIIRNSVILIDQIEQHIKQGEPLREAIVNAAVTRFRPIMLTAAAAILAMIPLVSSIFWGPMAVAIAGGLLIATILTLLVLPTMYATLYRNELTEEGASLKEEPYQ
ncbi:efflux RND transporter permease subunit [Anaeroarcus burkinensis]|uniref:efflux RND transporter permease subunit n=1 Tax=Anaeroarcus burkinensis TaxID=82376 RepID=UPI000414A13A|nr:efflux RND transporter permease subunit [Anaeroarcus burkinensis]